MPNKATFTVPPVAAFLSRHINDGDVVIDPFCGRSCRATYRNDLGFGGKEAVVFLDELLTAGVVADVVLLDPPYSPRQMAECYRSVGLTPGMKDTQNARLYKEAKERLSALLRPGGKALTFGWSSTGFGKTLGFDPVEIMLVSHGGAHNDTICVAEVKRR